MSILGSIFSKILGHHGDASPDAPPASASPQAPVAPTSSPNPPIADASSPPSAAPVPTSPVDVAAMLDGLASKSAQTFDWRHSVVDLMKLLGLDSALASRQALAKELNYAGDMHDSASMNIWLHKQVMGKLAANGGKVPDDLK